MEKETHAQVVDRISCDSHDMMIAIEKSGILQDGSSTPYRIRTRTDGDQWLLIRGPASLCYEKDYNPICEDWVRRCYCYDETDGVWEGNCFYVSDITELLVYS